jgi:hypothetical protein
VPANILNKQLKTADEWLSYSLGVGQGVAKHFTRPWRLDPLGQMLDTCECSIEPLGSIKCREFFD